ncbi:Putative restriction endonuclease domain-containing protein [Tumidithrix helvetica PCC 7403]|uniref:Uma2 family endonuclease n=1 Tax=Tumidithrix helvetica TaxID=3457545 RepID=UPI003CAD820C
MTTHLFENNALSAIRLRYDRSMKLARHHEDKKMIVAIKPQQWQQATWSDYETVRDDASGDASRRCKLFYHNQRLWIEMGAEGINHAQFSALFEMIFAMWVMQNPQYRLASFRGCQIEKTGYRAAAPDIVVYLGEDIPVWEKGESRFISLDKWRSPDLVGEISDTTLAIDLDQKKRLYADLGISEYWVIDVLSDRLFAFQLDETGTYQQCETSQVLPNLEIDLLERSLAQMKTQTNTEVALWFSQQIAK